MLFHSQEFLFLFLPCALLGTFVLKKFGNTPAIVWLAGCSLFFYGFGDFKERGLNGFAWLHLGIILFSIGFNYLLGRKLYHTASNRSQWLIFGITTNLLLLGYFKYADFLAKSFLNLASKEFTTFNIELPLAISFFTFQQIAFLVDLRKKQMAIPRFRDYLLFVAFFPQLIAGPIVKCQNIVPQLRESHLARFQKAYFWTGLCLFSFGLAKKSYLADSIKTVSDAAFQAVAEGKVLSFAEAWSGAMAFGFQIYFDFSAYSDIAIGLGFLFGLQLPINFNSPYKATSIIDFWRRWHITLSEFLRDYLYIPLGGNRSGVYRSLINVLIVMLLGGLWHGASWNFVVWGGLHGLLIASNHLLRKVKKKEKTSSESRLVNLLKCFSTFLLVTMVWTFFRGTEFTHSLSMVKSMLGFNGLDLPRFVNINAYGISSGGIYPSEVLRKEIVIFLPLLAMIAWFLPNTQKILGIDTSDATKPTPRMPKGIFIFLAGVLLFLSIKSSFELITLEYLYFRF